MNLGPGHLFMFVQDILSRHQYQERRQHVVSYGDVIKHEIFDQSFGDLFRYLEAYAC